MGVRPGARAERHFDCFDHPDAVRPLGPALSPEDRVRAAYAIAIEDGWPEEEIDELDHWRREVLVTPEETSDES